MSSGKAEVTILPYCSYKAIIHGTRVPKGSGKLLKMILATGEEVIDNYIKENIFNYDYQTVPFKKPLLEKAKEYQPDMVVLSALLPGEESIREIIFDLQRYTSCRIILLGGNVGPKSDLMIDAFFLGVRDFLFDPIEPQLFLSKINQPSTYAEAVADFSRVPPKSPSLMEKILTINKNKPVSAPVHSEVSAEAKQIVTGILSILEQSPGRTIEESLVKVEEGISLLLRRH